MSAAAQQMSSATPRRWRFATSVLFRFAFAYILLYAFPFPFSAPYKPPVWLREFWLAAGPWIGTHVLGTVVRPGPGDLGDAADEYVRSLLFFALSSVIALTWSVIDRKQRVHDRLDQWLQIYVRLFLGSEMVGFGMAKLFPIQFSPPTFSTLLARFGDLPPSALFWSVMGTSRIYTLFAGVTEVLGGALLFVPRLTMVGALISSAALVNVFFLDLGFDINVKQYSLHLLLFAGFLLAPSLPPLTRLLVSRKPAQLRPPRPLFQRPWLNRVVLIFQIVYGGYVVTREALDARRGVRQYQQTLAELPFYGIWSVEEFRDSGEVRQSFTTEGRYWSRLMFEPDQFDGRTDLVIEMANGTRRFFYAEFDKARTVLNLRRANDERKWVPELFRGQPPDPIIGTFRLTVGTPGHLQLEGDFEGQRIQTHLRADEKRFLLLDHGFHWVHDRLFWAR
jgi:uncharacterized membrane protein YphA (DoxX/SURF4 family)